MVRRTVLASGSLPSTYQQGAFPTLIFVGKKELAKSRFSYVNANQEHKCYGVESAGGSLIFMVNRRNFVFICIFSANFLHQSLISMYKIL